MTIRAIYEHGIFRPVQPVELAENAEVENVLPSDQAIHEAILSILNTSYPSGESDVAERHSEHQP